MAEVWKGVVGGDGAPCFSEKQCASAALPAWVEQWDASIAASSALLRNEAGLGRADAKKKE